MAVKIIREEKDREPEAFTTIPVNRWLAERLTL